nr:MAG TPA: hypothetical protein [Caudoviricetes sp.]
MLRHKKRCLTAPTFFNCIKAIFLCYFLHQFCTNFCTNF